jgi:hypothetical protein
MGMLQEGHIDDGKIIDSFLGILYMHTLRNEPTIEPNRKTMIYKVVLYIVTNYRQGITHERF